MRVLGAAGEHGNVFANVEGDLVGLAGLVAVVLIVDDTVLSRGETYSLHELIEELPLLRVQDFLELIDPLICGGLYGVGQRVVIGACGLLDLRYPRIIGVFRDLCKRLLQGAYELLKGSLLAKLAHADLGVVHAVKTHALLPIVVFIQLNELDSLPLGAVLLLDDDLDAVRPVLALKVDVPLFLDVYAGVTVGKFDRIR